jgi:hypothetical protein
VNPTAPATGAPEVREMPEITLSQGTIEYRDEGAGPPVLLIHGAKEA